MDNLPAHKITGVREAIKKGGARLLFLPPNSPDTPIEMAFSKLKALLRKADDRTVDERWIVVADCLSAFKAQECRYCLGVGGIDGLDLVDAHDHERLRLIQNLDGDLSPDDLVVGRTLLGDVVPLDLVCYLMTPRFYCSAQRQRAVRDPRSRHSEEHGVAAAWLQTRGAAPAFDRVGLTSSEGVGPKC